MRWVKRHLWKTGIAIAAALLLLGLSMWLLVFVMLVPASADAYSGLVGHAIAGTAQAPLTPDATMTALQKEQLTQQVRQLDNWWLYWLYNGSTAFIAAFASVVVALFGIYQWAGNRKKDLNAQAEERFKTAVTALGNEKESVQVGGAILLRSFLHEEDKKSYGRYYTQVFDLAVAYLRLPRIPPPSEDPDAIPHPPEDPKTPLPLTPLSRALIAVFKDAFPLARSQKQGSPELLDARAIQLNNAHLEGADLKRVT